MRAYQEIKLMVSLSLFYCIALDSMNFAYRELFPESLGPKIGYNELGTAKIEYKLIVYQLHLGHIELTTDPLLTYRLFTAKFGTEQFAPAKLLTH